MRLIDADFVKKALSIFNDREHGDKGFFNGLETCKEIIDNAPTIEAVSVGTLEQFKWERDLAIEQLNEIGKDLGSKMDDVETVRHGKWIEINTESGIFLDYDEVKCSECGFDEYFNKGWARFKYCPTCGAKMDVEEK